MKSKIEAFLNRREIRDLFDIEFLVKRGIELKIKKEQLQELLDGIKDLGKKDYTVKLGSILDSEQRKYYIKENFKLLIIKIKELLATN